MNAAEFLNGRDVPLDAVIHDPHTKTDWYRSDFVVQLINEALQYGAKIQNPGRVQNETAGGPRTA